MKNVVNILLKTSIILILLSIMFYTFNANITYADDFNPDIYKPNSEKVDTEGENVLKNVGQSIVGPIRMVGSFMSVFALILIGIKYMVGSVEEKAEYKKTLLPYIIGCIMVFGIINIVGAIYDMAIEI